MTGDRVWVHVLTDETGARWYALYPSLAAAHGQSRPEQTRIPGPLVLTDCVWHYDEARRVESATNVWGIIEGTVADAAPATRGSKVARFDRARGMVVADDVAASHATLRLPALGTDEVARAWGTVVR